MIARILSALLVCASVVSAAACSAQPAQPTQAASVAPPCTRASAGVTPVIRARHDEKHADRIAEINRALGENRYDVLVMGDSIVQRWPDAVLDTAFPGKKVLNMGIRGEWVAEMLYRLKAAVNAETKPESTEQGLSYLSRQSPKTVVVMIGTNDLRGKSTCYIADGIEQVTEMLKKLYPAARIVILGILPRGNPQGQFAPQIAEVNRMVADRARQTGVFRFVDLTPVYACGPQQPCDMAIPNNYIHPSDKGYARLTPALRDDLAGNN